MSAWDALKASSSLVSGDAWTLLTNPKTGGSGTGVVINDGYTVSLMNTVVVSLASDIHASYVQDGPIELGLVPPLTSEIE